MMYMLPFENLCCDCIVNINVISRVANERIKMAKKVMTCIQCLLVHFIKKILNFVHRKFQFVTFDKNNVISSLSCNAHA